MSKTRDLANLADLNFDSGTMVVDKVNDRVGVGNATPSATLDVDGTIKLDGNYPTGTNNVALGDTALDDGSLSGNHNTAIGSGALTSNTSGAENTATGTSSLLENTTGSYNTAVGRFAMRLNTTANNNTAVGKDAMYANTTGTENVGIGKDALASNTTASYNTATGYQSLFLNTTGASNTAYGNDALRSNTTASENTAVGYQASFANTTGTPNAAFGYRSQYLNTTGNYNSSFGAASLRTNTTGSNNVSFGYAALYSNTTASNSTAVGYQAGYYSTGQRNAFFGSEAGQSNTTGESNTYLGRQAGQLMTTGNNNTIIGRYGGNANGLDIRTSSNNVVLSDGDGNNVARWDSNGWVDLNGAGGGRIYFKDKNNSRANVWSIQPTAATLYIFDADGSNYAYLNQNFTGWSFASDQRLKENIVDLDYGLNTVLSMRPKRYTFLPTNTENIGFVAQELLPILPEAVTGTEQPFEETDSETEKAEKCLGISKEAIIPVLVKAIQEQQETITALTARIEALETN